MELTTLEDYVRREVFKTDKELFDLCELKSTDNNKIETCIKEKKQNK